MKAHMEQINQWRCFTKPRYGATVMLPCFCEFRKCAPVLFNDIQYAILRHACMHARTHAHTHARTHARTHAHTHTDMVTHPTCTHSHARMHACTHVHTHTQPFVGFPGGDTSVISYPVDVPCPGPILSSDLFNHACDLCLFSYPDVCFSVPVCDV